jgi:hypothetical protein
MMITVANILKLPSQFVFIKPSGNDAPGNPKDAERTDDH